MVEDRKIGYIYMITSPSNRIYIGSTSNIKQRWIFYKNLNCQKQIKLYRSFVKYGVDNHTFEVIWSGDVSEMLEKELILGNWYEVLDRGLNCRLPKIGESLAYLSKETISKMSKSQTGRKHPESVKEKMSKSHKGKKFSTSHLINMKFSAAKKIFTKEHRNKLNQSKRNNRNKLVNLVTGIIYDNVEDASIKLNLTCTNIYTIIKRKRIVKKKYHFEYLKN